MVPGVLYYREDIAEYGYNVSEQWVTAESPIQIYESLDVWEEEIAKQYFVYNGRKDLIFHWRHYADRFTRIDPSPSAIMDMYVLTTQYYNEVMEWKASINRSPVLPKEPSPESLRTMFKALSDKKSATDDIIYHSTKFKILFGKEADEKLKEAGFEVMDHITVYQEGNDTIAALLEENKAEIAAEVLADNIVCGQAQGYVKEWNINGEKTTLGVEKIG